MTFSKIGVCSWSLRPANPAELAETLRRLRISAVQLSLTPVVDDRRIWGEAAGRLRDEGIEILSGMLALRGEDYSTLETIARTGGVRATGVWTKNRELAERVADVAAREGIGLVTFHAGFIPHERSNPERGVILERLREIADVYEERGVDVAFETGQETAETLWQALADLGRPDVGVNFDPANMILYGMGEPSAALRLLGPRVRQIHVKDARETEVPGTWGKEVVAGDGAVDWRTFFAAAKTLKRSVNFVIEREAGPTREADIAVAKRLIESHLGSEEN